MSFGLTALYISLVFLRPQDRFPALAHTQFMDVVAWLTILATAVSMVVGRRPNLRGLELPLGLAFLAWSAFSFAAATRWYGGAVARLFELNVPVFTFVAVVLNVSTRRRLAIITGALCLCLGALLFEATRAYYSDAQTSPFFMTTKARGSLDLFLESDGNETAFEGEVASEARVKRIRGRGALGDPNDLAQALVSAIPLVCLPWRRRRYARNVLLVLLPAAVLVWGILLTRSRGGLVTLAALLVAGLLIRLRPRARRLATVLVLVLALPGFVSLFGYALQDTSAEGRLAAWSEGLAMLKRSPIWGIGSSQFSEHYGLVAHNSFVQCFAETGLVGYFFWLGLIVVNLERLSTLAETASDDDLVRWARALRLSLIAFLVAGLFLSRTTQALFFFLIGVSAALSGIAERLGHSARLPRWWWAHTLLLEFGSIVLIWLTVRASH